jgi:hypothetical protein
VKIKSRKDFWSGLMFIITGIGFAWGATSYSFGSSARPGPAYFPFGLGILLALLGGIVLFKALVLEVEGGDPIGGWSLKPALLVIGAVALFGATLPTLGMTTALPLLIFVGSLASGEFSLKEVLINCVVLTVFSWLVFAKGLGLTIPMWPTVLVA